MGSTDHLGVMVAAVYRERLGGRQPPMVRQKGKIRLKYQGNSGACTPNTHPLVEFAVFDVYSTHTVIFIAREAP
jgi:hypothetical protein